MSKKQPKQQEPIAIVGISGLFPGSVDVSTFWNHILKGSDLITDIPQDSHWSIADYFDKDANARAGALPDKTYAKRGAFLPKVPFETLKEGIPPSLLPSTDTAQLLSLMVARVALEECFGGPVEKADRSRVSCILGVTSGQELFGQMAGRLSWPQWIAGMRAAGIDEMAAKHAADEIAKTFTPWSEASFPGLLGNVVAGRIANRLDLGGSNAVTDAACASSFAAISMGVDELLLGRADVVLTGGVDTLNDIFMYMCFTKTPALSAAGDCRPFDAKADGTLLGEGLGMIALKRLSDAERDGNVVYATIEGIGTSSDGRSKSVYAPVSEGQAKALTRAYESAGYPASSIELVEAHGTGTKAGDVAELGGLRLAFDDERWLRADRQFCAIGSVKSQIGHTKSAAGAAGIIKAALALHEKVLPPSIKVDTPNPQADFATSPFYVNTQLRPWFRGSDHPRRAGVSSFGFGGSNWHITLQEYAGNNRAAALSRRDVEVLALSGDSKAALMSRAKALAAAVNDGAVADVAAFCERENAFFDASDACRVAFVVSSVDDLTKRLGAVAAGESSPTIFWGEGTSSGKVAFVFPGQGSQSTQMGQALALHFDEARQVWDRGCDVMPDVVRAAHPIPAFSDEERKAQSEFLTQTENAQPALGLTSLAALAVLRRLGVPMDMAAGHSFGELSALCAAGVFDDTALVTLARRRGELMKSASDKPGAMAAVVGDAARLPELLAPFAGRVVIANQNAPDQTVISGEKAAVDEAIVAIEATGLRTKRLPVSTAFHSPLVEAACAPLLEALQATAMSLPSVPVFANTTAAPHGDVGAIQRALSEQVRGTVRFVDEVKAMADAGATVFVEVGSGTVLTGLVSRIVPSATAVAFDPNKGLSGVFSALAKLCAAGVPVALPALPRQRAVAAAVAPSKTAVMISGANVGRPARPAPAPVTISAKAPVAATQPTAPAATSTTLPVHPKASVASVAQVTNSTPVAPMTRSTTPAPSAAPAPQAARPSAPATAWVQVFQEGQQQTMDAHLAFQKSLADGHAAYLAAFESTSQALLSAISGRPMAMNEAPAAPVSARPATPAPVVSMPVASTQVAAPVAAPIVTAPVVSAPVVVPVVTAPVVAATAAAAPAVNGRAILLAVVAEKTGYPESALDDSMHLESDLGIDSIKRVEILGAIKERVPAAASLDALKLAQLATLGEIAQALATTATTTTATKTTMTTMTTTAVTTSTPAIDARAVLLAVVAEKTGYPVSALDDAMHLESDLGIDSIKRVEILGALKDRVPAAASLDALKLAQLATLGEIAAAIAGVAPAVSSQVVVAAVVTAPAAGGSAVVGSARDALFAVVAEKTGYPSAALDDAMHLESDLGIDSIKRVEILGALKERVPAAAALDALKLAQLATLGEIASAIGGVAAPATTTAVTTKTVTTTVAATVSSAPVGGVNPRDALFAVVAEKTGYPASALDDAMHLESDLGIDSIKRVEILGALKEAVPAAASLDALKLAQLATLGEIAAAIAGASLTTMTPATTTTTMASSATSTAAAGDTAPRAVVRLAPAARGNVSAPPTPVVVFTRSDACAGLGELVQRALAGRGVDAVHVHRGPLPTTIGTLVDLSALDVAGDGDAALYDALTLLQGAADALKASAGRALLVGSGRGRFAPTDGAAAFGLSGLAKTARQEWPTVDVRFVDVDLGSSDSVVAELLCEECFLDSRIGEVALSASQRLTPIEVEAPLAPAASRLKRGDVVVVTGGARGVTATCTLALAKAVPGLKIALLQRTVATGAEPAFARDAVDEGALKRAILADAAARGISVPLREVAQRAQQILAAREVRQTTAAMGAFADVAVVACDVQSADSVTDALATVRERFGPITTVVHGAGVLADKRIEDKTREQAERVIGTKVLGLRSLLGATSDDPVHTVVVFSSVAGRFGNVGQVDYSMANEAMTRMLAHEKEQRPSLWAKALHWGPWEGGMVTPELKAAFASRGITVIATDDGARAFVAELSTSASDDVEVVLGASLANSRTLADGGVTRRSTRITSESMPFLADHSVRGEVVLPVVVAVDLMLAAATDAGLRGPIERVEVVKGQRLLAFFGAGHSADVTVDAATRRVELRLDGTLAYRAQIGAATAMAAGSSRLPTTVTPSFTQPLYGGSGGPGLLFHGPRFQLIETLDGVNELAMTAHVHSTRQAGFVGAFASDVAALDAGLQLVLLWARHHTGGAFLPTGIGALEQHSAVFSSDALICVVESKLPLTRDGLRACCDVTFIDASGGIVMVMRDVVAHRLPDDDAFGERVGDVVAITAPAGAAE
jgi:malonyl CoA-acyl carrier protein transacylase